MGRPIYIIEADKISQGDFEYKVIDKDIFSLRTIIDNNFNECAEEMTKILKDDIDESTFDKFYSSIPKPKMDISPDTYLKIY